VSVINTATGSVTTTFSVLDHPGGSTVNPAGTRLYLTALGSNALQVFNTFTNTSVGTVVLPFPTYASPDYPVLNPAMPRLYISGGCLNVAVINTTTNTLVGPIALSPSCAADTVGVVTVTPDGARLYVTMGSGDMKVVETTGNTVLTTITNAGNQGAAMNPAGTIVYAASTIFPYGVRIVDTTTDTVLGTVPITFPCSPRDVAVHPAGTKVYATCTNPSSSPGELYVIETAGHTVDTIVPIGVNGNVSGLDLTPDGSQLFVPSAADGAVYVVDTTLNAVIDTIPVGTLPVAHGQFVGPDFVCGDGNLDPGEECDDNNANDNDACTNLCTVAECGDGSQYTGFEDCDDGDLDDGDGCDSNCTVTGCGNDVVTAGEDCDEGTGNGSGGCCTVGCTLVDTDGDLTCDRDDGCAHVTALTSAGPMTARKVLLLYKGNGPGSGDDAVKVVRGEFTPGGAFDPDSTHAVHIRVTNTGTATPIFSTTLPAGGLWSQPNPAKNKWLYKDTANPVTAGVKRMLIKEVPAGSGTYRFVIVGKHADLTSAPLSPATDDVRVVVEIEDGFAGECAGVTLASCVNKSVAKDLCQP
jgi:YVTN family beta-propeller protein/cysteine-rich repeat protein